MSFSSPFLYPVGEILHFCKKKLLATPSFQSFSSAKSEEKTVEEEARGNVVTA